MNRTSQNNLFENIEHDNIRDLNRVSLIQESTFAGDQFVYGSLVGVL